MALSGRLRSSLSIFHQILRAESSLPLRYATHRGFGIPNIATSECLRNFGTQAKSSEANVKETKLQILRELAPFQNGFFRSGIIGNNSFCRSITTVGHTEASLGQDTSASPDIDQPQRIKFKRLDKTAKHIMNILDKEAVESVQAKREIPDLRPGYIVQLKVEVPENKRRVSVLKGIVIARRNAGLNTTFRLRRLVAGVGVESVFPLYSPNIKEMKVLDKKKVRRAKLYYLRDRMNPLKK
ncbi:50S ribosomal protein L19-2, chloroplastic-like isoform X1 [Phoenix dactylifera]|uniref:50S ribosomal protein L19-2, chloroplastic-like isoform X1 n=1 Tax=Phoenix dactylifera TaxID=42345 RepID=A0A8B7CLB0_PHODC|nr:50S ribosomal protein L19-2, chloroplastic-like isoform X1 [Phoenix dactylifera]